MADVREGSAPNFCPPVEEGLTVQFQDEKGDSLDLEFLGLVLHGGRRYGFFFPVDDDNPALSSGEVVGAVGYGRQVRGGRAARCP